MCDGLGGLPGESLAIPSQSSNGTQSEASSGLKELGVWGPSCWLEREDSGAVPVGSWASTIDRRLWGMP